MRAKNYTQDARVTTKWQLIFVCRGENFIEKYRSAKNFNKFIGWLVEASAPRLVGFIHNVLAVFFQFKKLHTGRSRNDQVATDIRLYLREQLDKINDEIKRLQVALLNLAEQEANPTSCNIVACAIEP
jgi:hypothetical protein